MFIFHKFQLTARERDSGRHWTPTPPLKSSQIMLGQLLLCCWCAAGNMQSSRALSLTISLCLSLCYSLTSWRFHCRYVNCFVICYYLFWVRWRWKYINKEQSNKVLRTLSPILSFSICLYCYYSEKCSFFCFNNVLLHHFPHLRTIVIFVLSHIWFIYFLSFTIFIILY